MYVVVFSLVHYGYCMSKSESCQEYLTRIRVYVMHMDYSGIIEYQLTALIYSGVISLNSSVIKCVALFIDCLHLDCQYLSLYCINSVQFCTHPRSLGTGTIKFSSSKINLSALNCCLTFDFFCWFYMFSFYIKKNFSYQFFFKFSFAQLGQFLYVPLCDIIINGI